MYITCSTQLFLFTDNSVLNEVDYVLCLDSIGGSDELFMHVSKPPKENTAGYKLVEAFKEVSLSFCGFVVISLSLFFHWLLNSRGFCNINDLGNTLFIPDRYVLAGKSSSRL